MTSITPAITAANTAPSSSTGAAEPTNPGGVLGQDAFLKLMVAQLQEQNPLQPGSDTEYVSQLASFTELEQMTNLATAGELSGALQMMGHTVTYTSSTGASKTGTVESVQNGREGPTLTVSGATGVSESSVTEIS